jgi:predicted GIY-YIG superfamily endonuclease
VRKAARGLSEKSHLAAWSVYIVRCADGTLYTGIATDVARRVEEHNASNLLAGSVRDYKNVECDYIQPTPGIRQWPNRSSASAN